MNQIRQATADTVALLLERV